MRGVRERVDRGRRRCIVRNMVASVHLLGVVGNIVVCVETTACYTTTSAKVTDPAKEVLVPSLGFRR